MKWLSSLFYVPKHEKITDKTMSRSLLFSVSSILLCTILFVGLSWSWFTSSVTSSVSTFSSAEYTLSTVVTENETTNSVSGVYLLNSEKNYTVTLTAGGSASTGFAIVTLDSETFYTRPIIPGHSFSFVVTGYSSLSVTHSWGVCACEDETRFLDGSFDDLPLSMALPPINPEEETLAEETLLEESSPEVPEETPEPMEEPSEEISEPVEEPSEELSKPIEENEEISTGGRIPIDD